MGINSQGTKQGEAQKDVNELQKKMKQGVIQLRDLQKMMICSSSPSETMIDVVGCSPDLKWVKEERTSPRDAKYGQKETGLACK